MVVKIRKTVSGAICFFIGRKIQELHPAVAEAGKFIDWKAYLLGRLQSEMRSEYKRATFTQRGE